MLARLRVSCALPNSSASLVFAAVRGETRVCLRIMFADDVAKCLLRLTISCLNVESLKAKSGPCLQASLSLGAIPNAALKSKLVAVAAAERGPPRVGASRVVSLATGNRCVGRTMSTTGNVVNDCHAEVLAALFQGCLYNDLKRALGQSVISLSFFVYCTSCFEQCEASQCTNAKESTSLMPPRLRFQLKKNASIHLCITETPCGDASIYDTPGEKCRYSKNWTGAKPAASSAFKPNHDAASPPFLSSSLSSSKPVGDVAVGLSPCKVREVL